MAEHSQIAPQRLDAQLRQRADSGAVPGVVAIAASGSKLLYQGAFGRRDASQPQPMTQDSVFWIASMTKAVTAAAAMQLVEQGRIDLDEPIGRVLPELASPQVLLGFDEGGAPQLRPARAPVTLRRLLTHTSGLCYDMWNADMAQFRRTQNVPPVTSCRHAALNVPLVSEPGSRWEYGISLDFVGKTIEAVSGQRLDAYLRDHLLAPLGMTDTAFKIGDAQRARLVAMHRRNSDGSLTPMPFEIEQDPEFHMGGGGLYGTAADYVKFMQMILNNGRSSGQQLLRPETIALMADNHIGDLEVTPMRSAIPFATNDLDLYPGLPKKWGLSFLINGEATPEGRSAGSLAWAGLANTYFWIDPARDLCGVILMQVMPFADAQCLETFAAFERAVYSELNNDQPA